MAPFRLFLLIVLLFTFQPLSAQEGVPWLSLDRLTFSLHSAYHYRPWTKYNESLRLAQDAIRYDPEFKSPQGSFEKIIGDMRTGGTIGYRVISDFSLLVAGGYTTTGSSLDLTQSFLALGFSDPPTIIWNDNQEIRFRLIELGIGVRYQYRLADWIDLSMEGMVFSSTGKFLFNYENNRIYPTQVYKYSWDADLRETKLSYRATLGIRIRFYGPFSIVSSLDYRWLTFPDLRGGGNFVSEYSTSFYHDSQTTDFDARLGETDGYFGPIFSDQDWYASEYQLHYFWSRTSAQYWWRTKRPTTLDLSGVGLKLGVQLDF